MRLYIFICCYVILAMTSLYVNSQASTLHRDSECYTPNGVDYVGKQNTTYVKGSGPFEPSEPEIEECLPWKDQDLPPNVTLPENYCRNPNNKLFPWCYVLRNGVPKSAYCHIPTCNTPALLNCYKVVVKKADGADEVDDLILDGRNSLQDDPNMRIGRCLNYCRSRKYDYAGVTKGDSCLCGTREKDGKQLKDVLNILHPRDCLATPCVGDVMQACGSETAVAVYDVEAGSCHGTFHDRDNGTIYSPRWPGNYDNELQCSWTLYVPGKFRKTDEIMKRHSLALRFRYFNIEHTNDTLKVYNYRNATDSNPILIQTYTGDDHPADITFPLTEIYAMHIVFNSDPKGKRDGFILFYEVFETTPASTTLPDIVITESTTTTTTRRTTTQPTRTPSTTDTTTTSTTKPTTTPKKNVQAPPKTTNATVTTSVPSDATSDPNRGGMIAGIVLGVILGIILITVAAIAVIKYKKHKALENEENPSPPPMFDNPVSFKENDTTL